MQEILTLVEAGNYLKDSVLANNVTERVYYTWIEKGNADQEAGRTSLYVELIQSAQCARAKARTYHVGLILKNAERGKDARASLEYLIRTDPDNWAKRDAFSIKHSGNIDSKVEVNGNDLPASLIASDPEASELACALLERLAARKADAGRTGDICESGEMGAR